VVGPYVDRPARSRVRSRSLSTLGENQVDCLMGGIGGRVIGGRCLPEAAVLRAVVDEAAPPST